MVGANRDTRALPLQVRDAVLDLLEERAYRPGDRIPSEHELAELLRVSRPTLREALKMLEEERVLYCKHGRGRFVAVDHSFIGESITRLRSVTNMLRDRSLVAEAQVLSLREQPAGKVVAAHLDVKAHAAVVRLERIRLAKQQPLIYSLDIFPRAIVKGPLEPQDFEGSLLKILEERWNVRLDHSRTTISAVQLDAGLSQEIGLPADLPWILLEQVNYTASQEPVVYSKDYHRGDRFAFHVVRRHY
jgi:GntR family transcriptional regulator